MNFTVKQEKNRAVSTPSCLLCYYNVDLGISGPDVKILKGNPSTEVGHHAT